MPRTLKEAGVAEARIPRGAARTRDAAFEDLSNRTNPRMPMVAEIADLLRAAYYGR